jgi:hypothetical protein
MRGRTVRLLRVHERQITSSAIALLFAVALCLFVLGRGPGTLVWIAGGEQNLKWLPFAGAGVSWLPYNESVKWLPYQSNVAALATPTPTPSPSPSPTAEPTVQPSVPVDSGPPPRVVPTPPPPTPVPAPVILFADDFSGDSIGSFVKGWTVAKPAWSIVNDGGNALKGSGSYAVIATGSPSWTNYTVTAQVKAANTSQALVLARYQSENFYYWCGLDVNGTLTMGQRYQNVPTVLKTATFDHGAGFYTVSFTVNGNTLTCKATNSSGTATLTGNAAGYYSNGAIGAMTTSTAEYHNFTVVRVG